jgi:hypothetical protein
MNIRLSLLSALFAGVFCSACAGADRILELKDVLFFKSTQASAEPLTIKVSGLAGHSALVISRIDVIQKNDAATIVAHLALASNGRSGSFDYVYVVPGSVNSVSFGSGNAVIWKRASGFEVQDRK